MAAEHPKDWHLPATPVPRPLLPVMALNIPALAPAHWSMSPPPWLHLLQSILYPFLMGLFCDPEMLMLFACLRPLPGSALFSGQTPDSPMCLPRVLQLQPLARGTPGSSHPGLRWREAVQCSG